MTNSTLLDLPFVEAAQAQKHVTVNEGLRKLDALVQLAFKSITLSDPPGSPAEGDRYAPASPATGDWASHEGEVAAYQDGAWEFYAPRVGWRAYVEDQSATYVHTGTAWALAPVGGKLAQSAAGASATLSILEEHHTLAAASFSDTMLNIPDRAIVLGVTARVTAAITGATSWSLGVSGATDRYGNGIGVVLDSTVNGVSGSPVAYYAPTPLRLTASGGDFTGGQVRLALHYLLLATPD